MGIHNRVAMIGGVSVILCGVLAGPAFGGASPIRCQIVLERNDFVSGENPPITLRLENTNAFDVWVPAPEAGVAVYEIELSVDGQDRSSIIRAPDHPSLSRMPYVRLKPGATVECSHLLFPHFDDGHLQCPVGRYTLWPRPILKPRLSEEPRPASNLPAWDARSATFRIRPPDDHEQAALDMLWRGLREIEDSGRVQKYAAIQRQHVELYDSFLKEYGDTPYADEVRNELVCDLFTLESSNPEEATIPTLRGPFVSWLYVPVTSVAEGYNTEIIARLATPDEHPIGALLVASMAQRNVKVLFHGVSDTAGHSSVLTASDAQAILDRLNEVWTPQANIVFEVSDAGLYTADAPVDGDLGCVVQWADTSDGGTPPNCTRSGNSDWDRVIANTTIEPGAWNCFFVWEYERDCPPDEYCAADGTEAANGYREPCFGDDVMTYSRGNVYAHELGHYLSESEHFMHRQLDDPLADPDNDTRLWNNLMRPHNADQHVHITVRQALIANKELEQ